MKLIEIKPIEETTTNAFDSNANYDPPHISPQVKTCSCSKQVQDLIKGCTKQNCPRRASYHSKQVGSHGRTMHAVDNVSSKLD